jgi:predicted small lipoprotein YifL
LTNAFDWQALTEVPAATASGGAGILAIMKFSQLLLLICLTGGVLGCGQKGPLVMPDAQKQKHKRTAPTAPAAPAAPAPAPTTPSTPPTANSTHS